jgi:hypothetical protein
MMFQGLSPLSPQELRSSRRRKMAIGIIVLVIFGVTLWILGILGVVHWGWTGIFSPVFAGTGLIITLFRWISLAPGAIIVYTRRELLGTDIRLYSGLEISDIRLLKAICITRRTRQMVQGRPCYVVYFSSVKPGHYSIYSQAQDKFVTVTVDPGETVVIDWC